MKALSTDQGPAQPAKEPVDNAVEKREVTIWSDGTRMIGDLYLPKQAEPHAKLPAVIFCNGTGGTRKGPPARLGPVFAKNGFAFLAFDYRLRTLLILVAVLPPLLACP